MGSQAADPVGDGVTHVHLCGYRQCFECTGQAVGHTQPREVAGDKAGRLAMPGGSTADGWIQVVLKQRNFFHKFTVTWAEGLLEMV